MLKCSAFYFSWTIGVFSPTKPTFYKRSQQRCIVTDSTKNVDSFLYNHCAMRPRNPVLELMWALCCEMMYITSVLELMWMMHWSWYERSVGADAHKETRADVSTVLEMMWIPKWKWCRPNASVEMVWLLYWRWYEPRTGGDMSIVLWDWWYDYAGAYVNAELSAGSDVNTVLWDHVTLYWIWCEHRTGADVNTVVRWCDLNIGADVNDALKPI